MGPTFELPCKHVRLKHCRYGPMLYLANDLYVGRSLDLYGEWSEGEMDLLRQVIRPGNVVLDIGANIGSHTLFFAQATGPKGAVLAFEPQRMIFQILCGNVALNGLSNVHTHRAALGRRPGSIRVPLLDVAAEQNFGALSLDNIETGESVELKTIDSLGLPACHVIKIDVEGMEGEVIAGGEATIGRFRPILYVENERQDRSADLIDQLFSLGYRLYWHTLPMFNPNNYFGSSENVFGDMASFNMAGIHRSLSQTIEGLVEISSPNDTWQAD